MRKTFVAMSLLAAVTMAATPVLAQGSKNRGPASSQQPVENQNSNSPVPGKPGPFNIVEIAVGVNTTGEFDYLLTAVGCFTNPDDGSNPLVELLTGEDKYTLFAPTDSAFRSLLGIDPPDMGEPGGEEFPCAAVPSDALFNILAYHLTEGRRFSNSVFNKNNSKPIEMLNGGYIWSNFEITLNDGAGQTVGIVAPLFDINASNGVIHVIDTVLLPE